MDNAIDITIHVTDISPGDFDSAVFSGPDENGERRTVVGDWGVLPRVPIMGEVWKITGEPFIYRPTNVWHKRALGEEVEQIRLIKGYPLQPSDNYLFDFLRLHKAFAGLGERKVSHLFEEFTTPEAIRTLLDKKDVATLSRAVTPVMANKIVQAWELVKEQFAVMKVLYEAGINFKGAERIVRVFPGNAVEVITRDIFCLLPIYGWKVLKEASRALNIQKDDPRYLIAAFEQACLIRLNGGHTCTEKKQLMDIAKRVLQDNELDKIPSSLLRKGLRLSIDQCALHVNEENQMIQPYGAANSEKNLKKRLIEIIDTPEDHYEKRCAIPSTLEDREALIADIEKVESFEYTDEQKYAISMALTEPVSVLTGGAGTGKSTIIKGINAAFNRCGCKVFNMALAGRAADIIRKKIGTLGTASTIASYIREAKKEKDNRRDWSPMIVIDEASMLDLPQLNLILKHSPKNTRLILVGDNYQLPPIGFGLPFHQLVNNEKIPQVKLSIIHRQAAITGIPQTADQIRNRVIPDLDDYSGRGVGVSFIECGERDIIPNIRNVFEDLNTKKLESQLDTVQVISAYTDMCRWINTDFSSFRNEQYRRKHNAARPGFKAQQGKDFAFGDPVIYTRNDYSRLVFNGNIGVVKKVPDYEKNVMGEVKLQIEIDFDGERHTYSPDEFVHIEKAYGTTIHKFQGSSTNRVIIPIPDKTRSTRHMIDRTLLYTAVTRAEEQAVFVGNYETFKNGILKKSKVEERQVGAIL